MTVASDQKPKTTLDELIEIQKAVDEAIPLLLPRFATGSPFGNSPEAIALVMASNEEHSSLVKAAYASEMTLGGHLRLLEWDAFKMRVAGRVEAERSSAVKGAISAAFVAPPPAERPVLVTTEYRGVFFGYATDTTGDIIHLKRARNCISWSADAKGFLGLANTGPTKGCKVGPRQTSTCARSPAWRRSHPRP